MHFMAYVLCALFGFSYLFLIKRYINRWKSIPEFSDYGDLPVNPFLSIIVTARNEEKNLFRCLSSIVREIHEEMQDLVCFMPESILGHC